MPPLTISICISHNQGQTLFEDILERWNYALPNSASPEIVSMNWNAAWSKLIKIALYKSDVDLSQVGFAVVGDLLSMNALRPFSSSNVSALGSTSIFHPIAWNGGQRTAEGWIWAIPWLLNPFAICYWRDMLEDAGVDESTAFSSFEHINTTLARLQTQGVEYPWVEATANPRAGMILASMWIWAAGGSLITSNGKRVLFDQPKTHKGLVEYFGLHRYAPTDHLVTLKETQDLFITRRAAAMMGSIPVINTLIDSDPSGDLKKRLGIALPPGPVFVGGSNLIVWQHSYKVDDAIDFIRFLSRADVQTEFARQNNDLPSRKDALADPFFTDNPHLSVFVKALDHGRTFPVVRLGGMVQDMFTETLSQVWQEIVAEPSKCDLETMVAQRFNPLAKRLNQRLIN